MNTQEVANIVLRVNGKEATDTIAAYRRQLKLATEAKRDLEKAHENGETWTEKEAKALSRYTKEINSCRKRLEETQSTGEKFRQTIENLDKASPVQLRRTLSSLETALKKVTRGSAEWNELTEAIRRTKTELQRVREETAAYKETDGGLAAWGAKWQGLATVVTGVTRAISGAYNFMSQYVDEYAELAEHMAGVTKYTGLEKEDVDDLNESFKKMDTRTSQAALNDLAADAGRLGIQGKQDILDFVDAANQINVALGEDLGEGAVKEIGKLAQMFGDADTMGLKQAMLATGSTINELAQSSSASEGYIMEFSSRLAGMGKTAGMTQAQIMALASVMDQNKVNAEQGSTALSRLIQVMYREPAKMAQAAGMDVQNFCALVKTDANEALLQFAQAVSQMGGMDKISPMLAELSLTGQGVSTVIATLAQNTDLVRETQEQASQAFQEATSVTNEYNVANNTVQANLEKSRQRFATLRAELGEQLMPVQTALTNTVSSFLTVLMSVWKFLLQYKAQIIGAATAYALYTAAVNASLAADKLKVFWSGKVVVALKAVKTALLTNPWGAVAAAIGLFVGWMIQANTAISEQAKLQKDLNKVREDAAVKAEEERMKIERLHNAAKNEKLTLDERKKAIDELNSIIPSYNAQLDETTGKYKENKKELDKYLQSLRKKYEIEGAKDLLAKIGHERAELSVERAKWAEAVEDAKKSRDSGDSSYAPSMGMPGGFAAINSTRKDIANATVNTLQAEVDIVDAKIARLEEREKAITDIYGNDLSGTSQSNQPEEPPQLNNLKNSPQSRVTKEEAALLAQKILYEKGLQTQQEYEQNCHDIRQTAILRQQKQTKEGSAQWLKLENERLENDKKLREQHRAWSEEQIAADEKQEKAAAEQSYLTGRLTYEQYQQKLNDIHLSYLAQRLDLARQNAAANQSPDTQKALSEAQAAYDEEDRRQQVERQEATLKEVNELKQKYLKLSDEEKMQTETAALEAIHQKGLISEEEYQKMLLAIKEQYGEAGANAQKKWYDSLTGINFSDKLTSQIMATIAAIGQLSEKLKEGNASWSDYAAVAAASLSAVSSMLTTATNLVKANMQIEISKVEERYDAEIEAAGSSTKKGQKLQEQKEKEVAKIKNKYNKRAMAMQIAQATAESILGAISAYVSVMKGVPYPANLVLAPVAAGIAMAAGAANIALIAKQQQAQAAGYYSGGFTGGNDPRKPAGIVHQKEFVVNAQAVANPALSPFLNLIDQAQRNNTVATLNPLAATTATTPAQPLLSINSNQSNQSKEEEAAALTSTLARLADQLEQGITAYAQIDGQNGVARQLARYNRLSNR